MKMPPQRPRSTQPHLITRSVEGQRMHIGSQRAAICPDSVPSCQLSSPCDFSQPSRSKSSLFTFPDPHPLSSTLRAHFFLSLPSLTSIVACASSRALSSAADQAAWTHCFSTPLESPRCLAKLWWLDSRCESRRHAGFAAPLSLVFPRRRQRPQRAGMVGETGFARGVGALSRRFSRLAGGCGIRAETSISLEGRTSWLF
jgi:hypothetical protein